MRTKIEEVLGQVTSRIADILPPPPGLTRLSPVRSQIADEIFARRQREIEHQQRRYLEGAEGAADDLARIARELISELRARTTDSRITGERAWVRLANQLDRRLPTEEEELLDDASLSEEERTALLRTLDRENRKRGAYTRFLGALTPLLGAPSSQPLTVLDLASGHGGFPLFLASASELAGHRLRIIASDRRAEYVAIGRERAARAGLSNVEFRVIDALALQDELEEGEVDIITSTLSLHHLGPGPVALLLCQALRLARRGILFIDLARALFVALTVGAGNLFVRDRAYAHDAWVSARKAFVPEELKLIARCAPMGDRLEAFYLSPGYAVLRSAV
jgi:SAM-dependent methyltransferase